jgi:hypothetical protein
MPRKFWFNDSGQAMPSEVLEDALPTVVTYNTGWRLRSGTDSVATGHRSETAHGVTRGTATFSAGAEPEMPPFALGAWYSTLILGAIPAGAWSFSMRLFNPGGANSAIAPSMRMRWRVFKGIGDGAGAVVLLPGVIVGDTMPRIQTADIQDFTATWSAPEVRMFNERLFFSMAIETRENMGQSPTATQAEPVIRSGGASFIEIPDLKPIEFVGAVHL